MRAWMGKLDFSPLFRPSILPELCTCITGQHECLVKFESSHQCEASNNCGKWCWVQGGHLRIAESNDQILQPPSHWNEFILMYGFRSTSIWIGIDKHRQKWQTKDKINKIMISKKIINKYSWGGVKLNIVIKFIWHQFLNILYKWLTSCHLSDLIFQIKKFVLMGHFADGPFTSARFYYEIASLL